MDIKKAAIETAKLIEKCQPDNRLTQDSLNKAHLIEMAKAIESGEVTGEKAHRWLGWLQAGVCASHGASLEELKLINFNA